MHLIVGVHTFLVENVEQVQKRQRKVYVACKGLQMFDGLKENNKITMRKLDKRMSLVNNWEGPYMFINYKDGNGCQVWDYGSKI
jgi:hypothetical protein